MTQDTNVTHTHNFSRRAELATQDYSHTICCVTDIVSQHKTITDTPTGMGTGPFTWQTPGLLLAALRPGPYEQEAHFDSLTHSRHRI